MKNWLIVAITATLTLGAAAREVSELDKMKAQARKNKARYQAITRTIKTTPPEDDRLSVPMRSSFQVRLDAAREAVKTATTSNSVLRVGIERVKAERAELADRLEEVTAKWTSAEAKAARTERLKMYLEGKRDDAKLATTKAIYQAILDELEKQ